MRDPRFHFSNSRTHYIPGTRVRETKIWPIRLILNQKSSYPFFCDFDDLGYEFFDLWYELFKVPEGSVRQAFEMVWLFTYIARAIGDVMTEHNYQTRLYQLLAEGKLPQGRPGLWRLDVEHDTLCGIHRAERCDCHPDFYFYPEGDRAARRKL